MQEVTLDIYSFKIVVGYCVYRRVVFVLKEIELYRTKHFFRKEFFGWLLYL